MVRHVALTLRIPAAMHEQLRRDAFEQRTSVTKLVIEAIRERPTKRYDDDFGDEAGRLAAEARRRGEHVSNRSRLGVAGECDYLDCTNRWTHHASQGFHFCDEHRSPR